MILKIIAVFCSLHFFCYCWRIKSNELNKVQELETKCILMCPFQKQTSDLYIDDITCEADCKIQHCVKGCHFLEAALVNDCQDLCIISSSVNSSHIFCFIGCEQSLKAYFDSIKSEISNLRAPTLMEHTLSATSVTLDWMEPSLMNESYMLQCRNVDLSNTWQFCPNQTWISHNSVLVQNLQPYTRYQFRVAIRLSPGHWYDIQSEVSSIIATLPGGLPTSPPHILTATAVSPTSISVIWEEGPFTNGPVMSYILQVNEEPIGYAAVKDISIDKRPQSYMVNKLKPSTTYWIGISARNSAGLGPRASVTVKTKQFLDKPTEDVHIMIPTEHSVYSVSVNIMHEDDPVLVYNTTHVIKGIALHVHRELLFISDSSGSIIVTSSKGLLTPQELPVLQSSNPSALTVDWLSDHLYILSEVLHPSGSVVYEVARCGLDGSNLVVVISGFIVKPHHIEVDSYNGYLFWVVRGVGLYRLDLLDISKTINRNVSPELILEDANLGAFSINGDSFRIVIWESDRNVVNAVSLDGHEVDVFCGGQDGPKFQTVLSLALANGSLFWTNGERMFHAGCDNGNMSDVRRSIAENKLFVEDAKQIIANTFSSQPFPVPVNPPTNFQAIFGHDIAKVSWEKPCGLAGQGEGAWSAWTYRLVVADKNRVRLFDFGDIKANQYTVSSLKSGTEYILKVAAYTISGEGPWSKEFRGKTMHRNASLLWSNNEGELLLSDVTGYRVTKIEPINFLEADEHFFISDIDWFDDQVFVATNTQQVFWYNLTSNTYGRIHDINGAKCISVEWLAKKLYWGNNKSKMIYRSSFSGTEQEILPIVVAAESLFLDPYSAYLYWSTKNTVEGARLDGTRRRIFYESRNPYHTSEIVGLALDIGGSELYWIEKTSVHPRQSALMIINVTAQSLSAYVNDFVIDKFTLINQDVEGGICYIDQHLVWVRSDDKNAMISGLNGMTTALIRSDNLSNLVTCTAVDDFIRGLPMLQANRSEGINVNPAAIRKSSVRIEGSFSSFRVIWDPVTNVNYGQVYYRVKMRIDHVNTLIETAETSVLVTNKTAYVPINIVLQSLTHWATSKVIRVTLRSPSSSPSPPTNPRIFVTHKKKTMSQQKDITVLFRWSPPLEPNGIVHHYELSCWVTDSQTNNSGTMCSSSQISTKTLEFTLQNLPSKTYNFRVRACTESGCGNWSEVVRTNSQGEISIPKLLLGTNEGLVKMDYDRQSFVIANAETKNARDMSYDADHGTIFWLEKNRIYQSDLNLHLNNVNVLVESQTEGTALCYDWVARHLYWVETNGDISSVIILDLNRNEEDRLKNTLFVRNAVVIKNIIVSPMNSMLYWVETENSDHTFGTLMTSSIDGSRIREFFSKDFSFAKNDITWLVPHSPEELEASCNWNRSTVGSSISLYPSAGPQYRLLWYDISTSFIVSSDLDGLNCKRIVKLRIKSVNDVPRSMTADIKRVYWRDADETNIYSVSVRESGNGVERVATNSVIRLHRILAYGSHLQLYPESACLWPHSTPEAAKMDKISSDSIALKLSPVVRHSVCKNVSMATVEYSLYFGPANDDGTSNCTSNLKSCSQAVTYDRIKKITKLKPYTKYVFIVGTSNYYSQLEGKESVLSRPVIYRTAPGVPSPARNVTALAASPNVIFVTWMPPEQVNAEAVGYSVMRLSRRFLNETIIEDVQEQPVANYTNTSIMLKKLKPDQEYLIWVKTFPMRNNRPTFGIGYKCSENVTVRTYSEPANLTLLGATSHLLNVSIPESVQKLRFELEMFNGERNKWIAIPRISDKYVEVGGLQSLTSYRIRTKIWYSQFDEIFLWTTQGFTFQTMGEIPSPPGVPIVNRLAKNIHELIWEPSNNFGFKSLVYWLEGQCVDESDVSGDDDRQTKHSSWIVYYKGSDCSWITTDVIRSAKYQFRTRSENEYGFSEYSKVSREYDFGDDLSSYSAIAVLSSVPAFSILLLIIFCSCFYVYCKSCNSKREKLVDRGATVSSSPSKNSNFELVVLQEIPAGGTNSVKNNLLYASTEMEEAPMADEYSQIANIPREQITLTKFLGSGAFGEVYEGTVRNLLYVNIETKVAIKALRKNATEQEKVEFLKEACLMSNFKHQHILQLLGLCTDSNPHFIIMELMEGGDLLSYLRTSRSLSMASPMLTYLDLLRICCDVAGGCCYLEEQHFVHRDLACRNCLVSSKDPFGRVVKIGDFGLARDIYRNDYYRKEGEGLLPVRWMAPESLVDGVFTRHSDVWSFSVLLWEVMTLGQQPYQARSNVEVLQYVRSGGRLTRPTNCPLKLYELMQKCWNNQPKERPTFSYCLHELENLKNNCASESTTTYTTCLPSDSTQIMLQCKHASGTVAPSIPWYGPHF